MHEIVCVGDVHEGLSFDFRIDPETGISERALDLHRNFAKTAAWAIEHRASLFCILGDLFDRAHVAPVFREMVRSEEHTSELQSRGHLVCRLLLEKKNKK